MKNPNSNSNPTNPDNENTLQEELLVPILMGERVIKLAEEAESSKPECRDISTKVKTLCEHLRAVVRFVSANPSLNERPIRRMVTEVSKNMEKTHAFVRKCKRKQGVLRHVLSIRSTGDYFKKVWNLLESSNGDMVWLLSIFESKETNLSLPPIASTDPILAWVWTYTYTLQLGHTKDRADAANELGSLARDNDRNKFIIMEEGGILPLLKLLKDSANASPDSQVSAANALLSIASNQLTVIQYLINNLAVPAIVKVLADSPFRVRVSVANLVSEMAEQDSVAREEFTRANVVRPLVSLLSMDIDTVVVVDSVAPRNTIHSLVLNLSEANPDGNNHRRDRERESADRELRNDVKVSCAKALWKLTKECLLACKKITETKGLICLAKIIESGNGELRFNCLMAVMEIAVVAESNAELRRAAFKPTAPAAKAVLDQLLRVVREETDPALLIPAIKSIGCLARNFPGNVPQVLGPLITQIGNRDVEVANEAALSLVKFVCKENYNCVDHSKVILELNGIPKLMSMLQRNDRHQVNGLKLLCYLALHVGNSKVLEQERVLSTLEKLARPAVLAQDPELKEVFAKAIHQLTLYQPGAQLHRQNLGL